MIRVSEKEKNKLKILAKHYAGGDLSAWLRYAGFNVDRKYLTANEIKKR